MVIILVFLTFLVSIFIAAIVKDRASKREVPFAWAEGDEIAYSPARVNPLKHGILQFPKEVYYHDGHAWAKIEGEDRVMLGLDDLTQRVMGKLEEIEMPPIGSKLKQGKVAWTLHHGKRKLSQLAPLGGKVVEVNEELYKDPSLLNRSPYKEGWILKIKPESPGEEIPRLMDSLQMRMHFDQVKAELRSSLNNETLGMVYGDGEEVITEASDKLDEKWWRILVKQLFHSPQYE